MRKELRAQFTPLVVITVALVVILLTTEAIFHWSLRGEVLDIPAATHRARVLNEPREHGKVWSARVELLCADHAHGVAHVQLTGMLPGVPASGSTLLFHAPIVPPIDTHNPGDMAYGTWLRRHGVRGTAFCGVNQWRALPGRPGVLQRLTSNLRSTFLAYVDAEQVGPLLAMTLGDRSRLSSDMRTEFSQAGTSHVLALSGLHLGILVTLFQLLVFRWLRRRWLRVVGALGGVLLLASFVLMVGAPPSLVRAATMLGLYVLCSAVERRGLSLHTLCMAALAMLLLDPTLVLDAGTQFSFVSVAGILIGVRLLPPPACWRESHDEWGFNRSKWQCRAARVGRGLWTFAVVSLSAQVATLPLVMGYFHTLPLLSLPLSFVVIPLTYAILLLAILLLLTAAIVPPVVPLVGSLLSWALMLLSGTSAWASHQSWGHVDVRWEHQPALVLLYRTSEPEAVCPQGVWRGCVLQSPSGRVAKVDRPLPAGRPSHRLGVRYLWMCRGARGSLTEWIRLYEPAEVVLDATLPDYYRRQYLREAADLGLAVHDISREGALRVE